MARDDVRVQLAHDRDAGARCSGLQAALQAGNGDPALKWDAPLLELPRNPRSSTALAITGLGVGVDFLRNVEELGAARIDRPEGDRLQLIPSVCGHQISRTAASSSWSIAGPTTAIARLSEKKIRR